MLPTIRDVLVSFTTDLNLLLFLGVLAVYIEMTGKKVDKGNDLKELSCCIVQY